MNKQQIVIQLDYLEVYAVLENIKSGAIHYFEATGSKAIGLENLYKKINAQAEVVSPSEPEKTYTREEVAKVLCGQCQTGTQRYKIDGTYEHCLDDRTVYYCSASDWLKATEKGG
jgi:hypothetical protein